MELRLRCRVGLRFSGHCVGLWARPGVRLTDSRHCHNRAPPHHHHHRTCRVAPLSQNEFEAVTEELEGAADVPMDGALQLPSDVPIVMVDDMASLVAACDYLSTAGCVGIDCEWRAATPGITTCVALLQLATGDKVGWRASPCAFHARVRTCSEA